MKFEGSDCDFGFRFCINNLGSMGIKGRDFYFPEKTVLYIGVLVVGFSDSFIVILFPCSEDNKGT